ncbi:hypothetical protein [uncultured Kriegella sp.]|uniref:hypothetical protein n=1 Tax=uncultured Kriegella sp. TaxID=1798910 RepID=UPI0030D896ED
MNSLKNSPRYKEAIQELNLPFGNYYLFDGFVVAEVYEDIIYTWEDHGKKASTKILELYDSDGSDLVFITNRINNYSCKPTDWMNFFRFSNKLKGYGIVSYSQSGHYNALLEKLFVQTTTERFSNLENAIAWAKNLSDSKSIAS